MNKKLLTILGAVFVVLLMVSTATAVQQTNSSKIMEKIKTIKTQNTLDNFKNLREKLNYFLDKLKKNKYNDPEPAGVVLGPICIILAIISLFIPFSKVFLAFVFVAWAEANSQLFDGEELSQEDKISMFIFLLLFGRLFLIMLGCLCPV